MVTKDKLRAIPRRTMFAWSAPRAVRMPNLLCALRNPIGNEAGYTDHRKQQTKPAEPGGSAPPIRIGSIPVGVATLSLVGGEVKRFRGFYSL